jgi:hypothetical protein
MSDKEHHDTLKEMLQDAVTFEFTTIPAYLYMIWSIDISRPIGAEIEGKLVDIVRDEMLHMSLCCNMLVSIGGQPKLFDKHFTPSYPAAFPGGIHRGVKARLLAYSPTAIKQFMLVEYPKITPIAPACQGESQPIPKTVGQFYDELLREFHKVNPQFGNEQHQIEWGNVGGDDGEHLFKIRSMADVERAIAAITSQGEGSDGQIYEGQDLSHYYELAQLCHGQYLQKQPDGKWDFSGQLISPPEQVFNPAEPCSWHQVNCGDSDLELSRHSRKETLPQDIVNSLDMFNANYSDMLKGLENAWATGSTSELWKAIEIMKNKLEGDDATPGTAKHLMNKGYGPEFII